MNIKLTPDSMATILRHARPMKAFLMVPKGENKYEVHDCEAPDLESLDGVIDQGFDPHGGCGPTYWRMTASHYYSTMLTEKGVMLSITKWARSREAGGAGAGKDRRHHRPVSGHII
jgi:hypothetical protein